MHLLYNVHNNKLACFNTFVWSWLYCQGVLGKLKVYHALILTIGQSQTALIPNLNHVLKVVVRCFFFDQHFYLNNKMRDFKPEFWSSYEIFLVEKFSGTISLTRGIPERMIPKPVHASKESKTIVKGMTLWRSMSAHIL